MLLLIALFCSALTAHFDLTLARKCERIDTSVLPACTKAGYSFTANFSKVGQQRYQEFVSSELNFLAKHFKSCSSHSEAFMCARYVPKCSDSVAEGRVLPCREVCDQFVDDCETALRERALYNRYVAYCGLLNSTQCFKPKGFIPRANITRDRSLPSCEAVTKPACVTSNLSGLGNETKARLQNLINRLAPVSNSSCSSDLTRLACFLQTGPCVTNKGHTLDTCQSLRKEVRDSCKDELQRYNISLPLYVPNYPEVSAGDGLCYLLRWPVPRPKSEIKSRHKRLQCLCTTCENKTCTTDGSCLIYRNPEDGKHVKRCIVDGEDRDLICSNVLPHKEDVRCCETDFCNRRLVPENREKGRVKKKKKNPPGVTTTPTPSVKKSEKKFGISSGILATAVVGSLLIVTLVTFLLYRTIKKLRDNSRARQRRNSGNYVHRSNISSNGRAVTIGDNNKGFEHANEVHNGIALY